MTTAVAAPPATALLTVEEYLAHPASEGPSELVRGELRIMAPAGGGHATVLDNLYPAAGTRLLWVIDPLRHTVAVHSPAAPTRWLDEPDTLDGGDVVPGFAIPVADLFDGLARETPASADHP